MSDNRPSWEEIYMEFAQKISERSTCSRLQVGCVVVSGDNQRVLAAGYNGNWAGGPNDCDSETPGACGCLHAEVNCLLKLSERDPNATLYSTVSPCYMCAKLIINAGIKNVTYKKLYRDNSGLELLTKASVRVVCTEYDGELK